MLTKQKGDIAAGRAIAYFLSHGYEVCLPIGDKRNYDLIVEKDNVLKRVQVKYAGIYAQRGKCQAALRVMGGNQSFFSSKKYPDDAFELLFVHTERGADYLLPWASLKCRSVLNVESPMYDSYLVSS